MFWRGGHGGGALQYIPSPLYFLRQDLTKLPGLASNLGPFYFSLLSSCDYRFLLPYPLRMIFSVVLRIGPRASTLSYISIQLFLFFEPSLVKLLKVAQAGLQLTILLPQAPRVLGLECATVPS